MKSPVVAVEAEKNAAEKDRKGRLLFRVEQGGRHHAPDARVECFLAQHPVLRHRHQGAAHLSKQKWKKKNIITAGNDN